MKNRLFLTSLPITFANLVLLLVLTIGFSQSASAQCQNGTGTSPIPQDLRVDVAVGTTGLLLVTWNTPSGATYTFNVCRSTSPTSGYQLVNYCSVSGTKPEYSVDTTSGFTRICRDDNGVLAGSNTSALTPGTTYYYSVQACNSSGANCGAFNSLSNPQTSSLYSNAPITCSGCGLPSLQGTLNKSTQIISTQTPNGLSVATSVVIPSTLDKYPYPCVINGASCSQSNQCTTQTGCQQINQHYAYHNPNSALGFQNKLVVSLPGSEGLCNGGNFLWVAQNLGYDTLCVNYDNNNEQESICDQSHFTGTMQQIEAAVAACFTLISQAKLNFTGPCIMNNGMAGAPACGVDSDDTKAGKTTPYYYVNSVYDAVTPRLTLMLYYLWCNTTNTFGTSWQNYLLFKGNPITTSCPNTQQTASIITNYSPKWSSIILSGFSQGGDMSTFADYYYATTSTPAFLDRAINLSAPPSADPVSTTVIAAGYLNSMPTSLLPSIFGLISANDPHYCIGGTAAKPFNASDYQAVWTAMGFTSANGEGESDFNYSASNPQPCPTNGPNVPPNPQSTLKTAHHNLVNWAPVNEPGGAGHTDTLFLWNEDFYEFMLIE